MYYYEVDGYEKPKTIQHKRLFPLYLLERMYKKALIHADLKREYIAEAMCSLYEFEMVEDKYVEFIEHDIVIDTDCDYIYKKDWLYKNKI